MFNKQPHQRGRWSSTLGSDVEALTSCILLRPGSMSDLSDGFVAAMGSRWPRLFFLLYYLLAVLIVLNIIVAFILQVREAGAGGGGGLQLTSTPGTELSL